MKVALFGGTGFVGSHIIKELIDKGFNPKVLVRPGSENKLVHSKDCEIIVGITALDDCLGPYVLKGLTVMTGRSKELKYASVNLSAEIFVAE